MFFYGLKADYSDYLIATQILFLHGRFAKIPPPPTPFNPIRQKKNVSRHFRLEAPAKKRRNLCMGIKFDNFTI
jgi:hypothetical protein